MLRSRFSSHTSGGFSSSEILLVKQVMKFKCFLLPLCKFEKNYRLWSRTYILKKVKLKFPYELSKKLIKSDFDMTHRVPFSCRAF